MNPQKRQTSTTLLVGIIIVLVAIVVHLASVSYKQSRMLPMMEGIQTPALSYNDLYPVATTSTPYGGWKFYENVKHQYKIAHPHQVLISNGGGLPDQSTTTEREVHGSTDEKQWDVIQLQRSNGDDLLVYLKIEAWGPDTVIQNGGGYLRMGSMELKPLVEELNRTWAGYEGISPPEIQEVTVAGKIAYRINHDNSNSSKIFVEHDKTKFIVVFNNDSISEMITNSLEFAEK